MSTYSASTVAVGLISNLKTYPCSVSVQLSPSRPRTGSRWSCSMAVKAMGGGAKYKGTQMREKKLTEMIENKVMEASEVCAGDENSDECKVAWDEVEEVSQAKAHLRVKLGREEDPLESFCSENPESEECAIYDD